MIGEELESVREHFARVHENTVQALQDLGPTLREWEKARVAARGTLPGYDGLATVRHVRVVEKAVADMVQITATYPARRAAELAGRARDDRKAQAYWEREAARRARWEQERRDEEAGLQVRAKRLQEEQALREQYEAEANRPADALTGWE